jgi:hypothetical protein
MNNEILMSYDNIQNLIYTIRGIQVMLDSDLAGLYQIDVKILNQATKRNSNRFPSEFMFQLTAEEMESLRSRNVTLNKSESLRSQNVTLKNSKRGKHRKYLPYAFTEQGVSMLSAVLRSEPAVKMSIHIINAFVYMRRFIAANAQVFHRMATLEVKQIETDKKIDKVLNALEAKDFQPKQGIFFDGQIFDAYKFVSDLFRSARNSILIIDNYIDDTVLTLTTNGHIVNVGLKYDL